MLPTRKNYIGSMRSMEMPVCVKVRVSLETLVILEC